MATARAGTKAEALRLLETEGVTVVELDYEAGWQDAIELGRLGDKRGICVEYRGHENIAVRSPAALVAGLSRPKASFRQRNLFCQFELSELSATELENLASLRESHPEITVKMIEDQNEVLIERVRSREADVGLGMFTHSYDDLEFSPMFEDELVAVFPSKHPLRREKTISWERLAETPLVLLPPKSSVRTLIDAGLVVAGNPSSPVTEVVSMVTALNMMRAGFGATVLPQLSLPFLKMTGMAMRPIGEPRPRRTIGLLRRVNRSPSPAERLLEDAIVRARKALNL